MSSWHLTATVRIFSELDLHIFEKPISDNTCLVFCCASAHELFNRKSLVTSVPHSLLVFACGSVIKTSGLQIVSNLL